MSSRKFTGRAQLARAQLDPVSTGPGSTVGAQLAGLNCRVSTGGAQLTPTVYSVSVLKANVK